MDFATLPPEITSSRMYSGPGSQPLLTAATAWEGLAAELQSLASSYRSVISTLATGPWTGPAAAAMAAAAAPYAAWMSTAATQAKEAAAQAGAAAGAYETAFASTVPPAMIAANRSQLAVLVATNIVGQNTAAIAAVEAQYGQMWAQDAATMYAYAGSSAAAAALTPFSAPPPTTNAAGLATQSTAVTHTASTSISANVPSVLAAVPLLLQKLASASTSWNSTLGGLLNKVTGSSSAASLYQSLFGIGSAASRAILPANSTMISIILGMVQFQKSYRAGGLAGALGGWLPNLGAGLSETGAAGIPRLGAATSAGVGRASLVGMLSVPPGWAAATPAIRMIAEALPDTSVDAVPAVLTADAGSLLSRMGLASMAGGALGGTATRAGVSTLKGRLDPARLEALAAELSKHPNNPAVQHWHTDSTGLDDLVAKLSHRPGIHAVHLSAEDQPTPTPTPTPRKVQWG